MIVTSLLHMFLALGLSVTSAHTAFYTIYPTFAAFLAIGFGLTLKTKKKGKRAERGITKASRRPFLKPSLTNTGVAQLIYEPAQLSSPIYTLWLRHLTVSNTYPYTSYVS